MNMVGELVLVRNRLQRLGSESEDEHMHKAVSNLDVVTYGSAGCRHANTDAADQESFRPFPERCA